MTMDRYLSYFTVAEALEACPLGLSASLEL